MAGGFRIWAAPVAGVALALLMLPAASAGPGATARLSAATGGVQADGRSFVPAISADGRFSAFYSDASNLVPGDANSSRDVFVHDGHTGETTRVSVDSSGVESNGDSFAPAISGDARFVAFSSSGSNLVAGDTNGVDDVFVRDRQAGTTARVSLAPGGAEANDGSYAPSISADGRYVAFLSDATNLVAADLNTNRDVFVFDRQTGTTVNASVDSAGAQANLDSFTPELSADGRFVVFTSFAANLIPSDTNDGSDVFLRDLQAGTTTRVSEYQGAFEGDGDQLRPSISADGRYVAFDSDAWNLAWGDTNDAFDVFVKDRQTDLLTRVSVDDNGTQSDGASYRPSLSADGRYVAFYSEAANLVPGDTNGAADVIIHDRRSGATKRVSVAGGGGESNGDSVRPAISADGKLIVFESDATNLVAGDSNRFTDIFVHDPAAAGPPPSPPVKCVVPRVIGLRLAVARNRIGRANCRVGRVRRARSRRAGRVLLQSPRAGSVRSRGAKVNLVVGRR
ncbi:MAG: PASTA domain-containing protein [Actinomycetota bacterium]